MQIPTVGITLKLSIMFIQNSGHSIFHNHSEDSIHDIRHQHQPLGQLQHHASCAKHIPGISIVAEVVVGIVKAVQETSVSIGISIRGSFSFSITPLASKHIPWESIVAV